jgi:aminopeptidase N
MTRKLVTVAALAAACLTACAPLRLSPPSEPRAAEDNLTESFARFRASQVRAVDYELEFSLFKGTDAYRGKALLTVELKRTDAPLNLDMKGEKLESVKVNGERITDFVERLGSLELPSRRLAPSMKIEIEFSGTYSKDGEGFQRSVDPEDSLEYVATDFEPYYAHSLFPCFDQPDLKATYSLTVAAPADWTVLSNELVESKTAKGDRFETRFRKTKPISTYLFFLAAGPFAEWTDTLAGLPLSIYARKSLAKFVDADKIFDTVKKGLTFFNDYFAYPYPYSKVSLIFIPEMSFGGMENPGAITMNEGSLFRGQVSLVDREGRDNTIVHELAHMWFGDLVTMRWWSDLWLNESFASYLASLCQDRALAATTEWQYFLAMKFGGYLQDSLVTTHPVEAEVRDVMSGKSNFDGITYCKGAAILQQLHYFAGENGFRDGLKSYFRKYAFGNTTRADFIEEVSRASNQSLGEWTHAWLQTSGPNRVQAKWSCDAGKVAKISLIQAPSSSGTLSPHRARVDLYKKEGDRSLTLQASGNVTYDKGETPVSELVGASCPDFVYPNGSDLDYALFALDPVSLKAVKTAVTGGLSDTLTRTMIWSTLEQMVRDSKLPVREYFEIAADALRTEHDQGVLAVLLGALGSSNYSVYLTQTQRATIAPLLEDVAWKRINGETAATDPKSDLRLSFFDFYVGIARTPEAQRRLAGLLAGSAPPAGIELDQDRRWAIVTMLAKTGYRGVSRLIAAEAKRDPTTDGKRHAYASRAAIPELKIKERYWADFQKPDGTTLSMLRSAASKFNASEHPELTRRFVEPYFSLVSHMDWSKNENLVDILLGRLFPLSLCSRELLAESESRLQSAGNLVPAARRAWLEANDELSRCAAIQEFSSRSP